ncbi:MAG: hypothetical protein IRY84_11465 [Thermobispora bispora]|nr:hypothetical protein [Thermobispora bispora]
MTALDEEAWDIFGGLHRLLLRLAGRVPDDLLTHARTMLGTGDLAYLPDLLTGSLAELGVTLVPRDAELLRRVPEALGAGAYPPAGLEQVGLTEETPATTHRFAPGGPADLTDDLLVDALTEREGVLAIRRALRADPGEPRRVYLVEAAPGVPAWELTLDGQRELTEMDDKAPQVEVFWSGEDLPDYHRKALARAALLWPEESARE